jgi:hypothetical protein
MGNAVTLGVVPRVGGPEALVITVRDAIPRDKFVVGRPASIGVANVPFADDIASVAEWCKHVGDGPFPSHQPSHGTRKHHVLVARTNGISPGHQRRTGWSTLRLRCEVEQSHPLFCETVDTRRPGSPQKAATVAAQLAVAEVVHQEIDDVGLLAGSRWLVRETNRLLRFRIRGRLGLCRVERVDFARGRRVAEQASAQNHHHGAEVDSSGHGNTPTWVCHVRVRRMGFF